MIRSLFKRSTLGGPQKQKNIFGAQMFDPISQVPHVGMPAKTYNSSSCT